MRVLLSIILLFLFSCSTQEVKLPEKKSVIEKPIASNSPRPVLSFAVQYNGNLNYDFCKRDVVYLDLFDYTKNAVLACKKQGALVLAYFSSQHEQWRTFDESRFKEIDKGRKLDDWKGERWVNTNSTSIREIMLDRIILAKSKGFDGIDVDNVDSFLFKTGFYTTTKDSIDYINFFINTAKKLDMKFSLKNALSVIEKLPLDKIDYFQNESCYKNKECNYYDQVKSPVFIIHYKRKCPKKLYPNSYTIRKKSMNEKDKPCD